MFGIFGLGPGSPGPLGGVLNPPPMQAFNALFHDYPPGIPVVPTTGMSPAGPVTGFAKQAIVPKPSTLMPPHLITGGTPFVEASVAAKAAAIATAHAHGTQNIQNTQNIANKSSGHIRPPTSGHIRPPSVPKLIQLGPSLAQQRINFFEAAAAKQMGGSAPKASVQEARPSGQQQLQQQQPQIRPLISMQEDFASAESMQEAHQAQ